MEKSSRIYVAGHTGMVGSGICRKLEKEGFSNIVTRTHEELDLRDQQKTNTFFEAERPEYVFMAAAKVGGMMANNTYRAEFLYDNLMIETNIIHAAYVHKSKKLLFLASSCIYPKYAPQPIAEESLLTGLLEPTNEPYAIAKITGIKLCDAYRSQYGCRFISAMPTNIYGLNDNYDLQNSHVIPALLRKFHEAKEKNAPFVEIWGTGTPLREFLYVDDLADACLFLMNHYDEPGHINVGSGVEISIKDLALTIRDVVGYRGDLKFDTTKPDGTPRKQMDTRRLDKLGWKYHVSFETGLKNAYSDFLANYQHV